MAAAAEYEERRREPALSLATAFPMYAPAAQDAVIEKVAASLQDTYHVDYIAPGHCTGEPTFTALQKTFGAHYLYAGLGTALDVGANPRAESVSRNAGEGDLRSCRALLAQSDDFEERGREAGRSAQLQ